MSAVTFGTERLGRKPPAGIRPAVRGLVLAVVALDIGILTVGIVAYRSSFVDAGWGLIAWVAAVAIVGAASLTFESGQQLSLDMPVLLSIGYLFGPAVAGLVAFAAYFDAREFRGEISIIRALFNRAQTSLSVMAGTALFALVGGLDAQWPAVLVAAFLAVAADALVNYGMVVAVVMLDDRVSLRESLSQLCFGPPREFVLVYASYGLLSVLLAEIYLSVGPWGLAAFATPVVLVREALSSGRRLDSATRRIDTQSAALRDVSMTIVDERRQERLTLAAGLHDDLLPPLFKVHLMGQVLRQDLANGRLLALEEDVPELLRATEVANESTRALIRTLKESPLGKNGLNDTLRMLVDYLEGESGVPITLSTEEVDIAPLVQLLAYQVARESLRNALRHSGATQIAVTIAGDGDNLRVIVADDGVGFHPWLVDGDRHFGLDLMRERVELVGGVLQVDSSPGCGTRIVARLPRNRIIP